MDSTSRPALLLVVGRSIGLAASFAIGIVLARLFDPAEFGTYKQFFLVYATLYGVLQLGMAESLYYFVPRQSRAHRPLRRQRDRRCSPAAGLARHRRRSTWRARPIGGMADAGARRLRRAARPVPDVHAGVDGARDRDDLAQAAHDGRGHLRALGHRPHAAVRRPGAGVRQHARGLHRRHGLRRPSARRRCSSRSGASSAATSASTSSLWRQQLGYALPFALAVGIEVILINYHQYVVAGRFDAGDVRDLRRRLPADSARST